MSEPLQVTLVCPPGSDDASAIARWLETLPGIRSRMVAIDDLEGTPDCDVVWVHAASVIEPQPELAALTEPFERGGVLLTGAAAALPFTLGIESEPPNDAQHGTWNDEADELFLFRSFAEYPHIRGHAAFRSHPLFEGLGGAAYTWWPRDRELFTTVTYRAPAWPARGRVVAVERSFIHINPRRATIWEYDPMDARPGAERRRVLCIGAYLPFRALDMAYREHVERLAWNALLYVSGRDVRARLDVADPSMVDRPSSIATVKVRHWRPVVAETAEDATLALPAVPGLKGPLPSFDERLGLDGAADADEPFTLAGRRAFVAGGEARGIDELWAHPVRVLSGLRVARALARQVTVTPAGIERRLKVAGAPVRERIFVPRDVAGAVVEWTAERDARLDISWRTDLRLMWPYPAGALGPLRWRAADRGVLVASGDDDDRVMFAFSDPPRSLRVTDASGDAAALDVAAGVDLAAGESVRLAAVGASDAADLARALRRLHRPDALVQARRAESTLLHDDRLEIEAPDPLAAMALGWAKERLASYVVDTPGVGRSLVAGYWGSRPDWFHDGRPGYAWFFGRDAVWTALAGLAVGDVDAARDVIRFLGARQDLSGKVLHECTTSGVAHYDSADATPLYLLLVARYLAWTGDRSFVRGEWDRVLAAYAFCRSTDTDGDGLIENTRVGHGWIEFGRLGGGTITGYNTAIWTAALREIAEAAESLGEHGFADELHRQNETAREAFECTLYDEEAGEYALNARRVEGRGWERNPTRTVMQSVPLLLGVADPGRARSWLDAISTDDFTAGWGVRMLPLSDPAYEPTSYHGGAVWPLFTGWASWAEYVAGRAEAGFRHWWMNVEQALWRERGAWDEVLHGTERRGRGVCPDQAWSTAMVVAPLVYGLLGVQPDACVHRLRLRPQIPAAWDRLAVRRLRVGDAHLSLAYHRQGGRHTFELSQTRGAVPLNVVFEPALTGGHPVAVRVDDTVADLDVRPFGERVLVPVQLVLDGRRRVVIELDEHGGD